MKDISAKNATRSNANASRKPESGSGVETFKQLLYYVRSGADAAYVLDLTLRITDLARLRKTSHYLSTNTELSGPKAVRRQLAEQWYASCKVPANIRHLVSK